MGKWVSIHKSMIQTRDLWILGMNIFIDIHQSQLFWGEGTRLLTYFDIPTKKIHLNFAVALVTTCVSVLWLWNCLAIGEDSGKPPPAKITKVSHKEGSEASTHTQLFSWFKNYFTGYRYIVQAHGFLQNVNHFRSNQKDLSENPKMMYLEDNFPI